MKNKSLIYLLLAMVCFFLVLSQVYGDQYISQFVAAIMPGASKSNAAENQNLITSESDNKGAVL